MFLTLKNEKTLKKIRSKTLKNNIFFILGRNLIIRSFEIPHSIWKLHKDFKSVFVFKFRQKTKKFTPKWQKPLFEKRVNQALLSMMMLKSCLGWCDVEESICRNIRRFSSHHKAHEGVGVCFSSKRFKSDGSLWSYLFLTRIIKLICCAW